MIKKIKINGVKIDSIRSMEKEILNSLKIKFDQNVSFNDAIAAYIFTNKIDLLDIVWESFSISLLKMRATMFEHKKEDFIPGNGNNMLFQALNDTLISGDDLTNKNSQEEDLKCIISNSFRGLEKVTVTYKKM